MPSAIPQGLRTTYLIHFVWELIFGLAGTLAARFAGDPAGYPLHVLEVNAPLGVTARACIQMVLFKPWLTEQETGLA